MSKKPVILFQRILPSYRVPIFRYLCNELNVLVCHSKAPRFGKIGSNLEKVDYSTMRVGRLYFLKKETAIIQNIFKPLFKYRPEVVISPASLMYGTTWLLLFFRPFFKYKLILWGHGIKNTEVETPFEGYRGKVTKWLYKKADAMLLYSVQRKERLEKLIETPVFVATNTLDTRRFRVFLKDLEKIGRDKVKQEVGFKSTFNIIYIGRLLPAKRIDLLLESFNLLPDQLDVTLHIIGEGSEMDLVKKSQHENDNIRTYGPIYNDKETAKLLFSSDIIVIPGNVGLGIIHAFSFGVPLITCNSNGSTLSHGPEIELFKPSENGLYCDGNAQSISDTIAELLSDHDTLQSMKETALFTTETRANIGKFIEGFDHAIQYCQTKN